MSKKWIVTLAVIGAVLIAAAVLWFTGVLQTRIHYLNPEAYQTNDTGIPEGVKHLDVHWISGKVSVAYHRDDTILLQETSGRTIGEDLRLRWCLDQETGTLTVQYGKDGARMPWNFSKDLTLTLPENIELGDVSIHGISGGIVIPTLRADSLSLSMTSGTTDAAAEANHISVSSTSGSIRLTAAGSSEDIRVHTTSGSIDVKAGEAGSVRLDCTSGDITADLESADAVWINSTSGKVTASLATLNRLEIDVTSGSVTAYLPEKPGFTAYLDKVSGKITYDLPMTVRGASYICGDGSGYVRIHTTSGGISLKPVGSR